MSAPGPHPADQLIRDLIVSGRAAVPAEIAQIVDRMATAPFIPDYVRVPARDRGRTYEGFTLRARERSITYHIVKRVAIERQWARGTTAADYLAHLERAVRATRARLIIYERENQHIAASIAPTHDVLTPEQLGDRPEANLLVVYSATRSIIRTGYQFSQLSQTNVPPEARWLS